MFPANESYSYKVAIVSGTRAARLHLGAGAGPAGRSNCLHFLTPAWGGQGQVLDIADPGMHMRACA
jgi:hypothetical protein